jgi:hypothetical protein
MWIRNGPRFAEPALFVPTTYRGAFAADPLQVQRRAIIDTMFDCGLAALAAERIDGGLSLMHDRR